jgi:nucleotide-binding universal stress UspA family protein
MYKRILVPVDGSETSNKALTAALQMARDSGGRVRVLHAVDALAFVELYAYAADTLAIVHEQAEKLLRDALDIAKAAGVPADRKLVEDAGARLGDVVADAAKEWDADLVVVGTHGRRGFSRALLGSGAEEIIRYSPVPVLVIRGDEPAAA